MASTYENAIELLEQAFKRNSDKVAYTSLGHRLTFAQVDELSQRFASYFRNELGLVPGDRIAIQLPNILQYPVVFYGAIRAGLIVVNTNPLYRPREIEYQLRDSGAKVLVVLSNVAHNATDIIKNTNVEKVIVTDVGDLHPLPKRLLINAVVKHVKRAVKPFYFENMLPLRKIASCQAKPFSQPKIKPESMLVLQYTGGTTGISKGAMLSHKNLMENVSQLICHIPEAFSETTGHYVACLPLYHIYALNLHALAVFSVGGHNILIPNPRDLNDMVKTLRKNKFTVFVGINTLFNALCRLDTFKSLDFSHLRITCAGGMALTEDAAKAWERVTGCQVIEGYGLTETSPVVAANLAKKIKLGTIGLPVPDTEVRLIDNDGNSVVGVPGELCVRGPQVMQGYWQNQEETRKVLSDDGWLKTGDIAVIDDEGWIKIVDRKKDMILVSGFNVYPNEVEDIVCQMPEVVEAAAIGIADEKCGEVVKLFVVPATPDLTKKMIDSFCRKNLTGYKVPKVVEFRESLPKSNIGKILRKELRNY